MESNYIIGYAENEALLHRCIIESINKCICWFVHGRIKEKIGTIRICHKISSVLYRKYSTVVSKYSTVSLHE